MKGDRTIHDRHGLIAVQHGNILALATEFLWRKAPSAEAREIFLGQACPGMQFDVQDDWINLYREAWLMPRMQRAVPYLGYNVVAGMKGE